jgi:hypothetical protein
VLSLLAIEYLTEVFYISRSGNFAVMTNAILAPGTYSYQISATDDGVESSKVAAPAITV